MLRIITIIAFRYSKKKTNNTISKAIVVAGGGPYPGNKLWDSTRMAANFAYRVLRYQGISKKNILYFSEDNIDLDNNGKADDIAGIPTSDNIRTAISSWDGNANTLILYLTDHGKEKTFHLSESETLSADHLNLWLSQYQSGNPNKRVIVIYDACMSGSFVPALSANNRIIVTSTEADEDAYFISQGSLSFSDAFWSDIFNGNHVGKSFDSAKQAVAEFQNPMIEIGSNISGEVPIGNGISYNRELPLIETVSCTISGNRITCTATAGGKDGIARVWAVIMPSDYDIGTLSRPVVELPSFELMPDNDDDNKYTGMYQNYLVRNIRITIYAEDRNGNTSVPSLTYLSGLNVSEDKAVIAAGNPDIFGKNIQQAEDALKFQRYADGNIMKAATVEELHLKLADCASSDTHDVLIYLVGKGSPGSFRISNTESLSATTLNLWLNDLQEKISGKVVVVYDADYSGMFIPLLKPPQGKRADTDFRHFG
ncbi:MAG: hypothetical protein HC887_00500 [Desulfobacteraceae bacterium]|nr:hypothetical protein [Desulfobacteraceae bacterium]